MFSFLLWTGIVLIVVGWLALGWQASKRLAVKAELDKFPEKKRSMQQRRSYCMLTILAGIVLLVISLLIN